MNDLDCRERGKGGKVEREAGSGEQFGSHERHYKVLIVLLSTTKLLL